MNVRFVTLGCKTNQYETNAMEQKFRNAGYELNNEKKPDIYVVNTCSVTNVAERKSRQMIRRAKELNSDAIVVVCGCYSQVAKQEIEKIDDVDIILGINEKNKIVEIVEKYINDFVKNNKTGKENIVTSESFKNSNNVYTDYLDKNNLEENLTNSEEKRENKFLEVSDVSHDNKFLDFGSTTFTELTRAVIKIQDGCDRFCTYCIIPYARGGVRSREPENVLNEIRKVAKNGIKEVVLTGIHIASYGKDFTYDQGMYYRKKFGYTIQNDSENLAYTKQNDDLHTGPFRLIELLEQINKIDGIERVRLGSIEPKLINKDFVEKISKLDKICHHFHLSLQSGCNETLKRMNRRYTTAEFEESVNMLRNAFYDVHLTTDIIVGFPGETEDEFNQTYEFLKKIKFYKTHVFKYSARSGTVAEKLPNQIGGNIKEQRSKKLIELSNKNELDYNKSYVGKEIYVLIEEKEGDYYKGHTGNYILAKVRSQKNIVNSIVKVKVKKAEREFVEA